DLGAGIAAGARSAAVLARLAPLAEEAAMLAGPLAGAPYGGGPVTMPAGSAPQ
ncbi:MAG: stage II sporulation protein SpoIID, partial [Alphaproteobacteria bacterium]|nr:stage II sporulation protein SpoIID [Alphaproteobacteria bacterium]